MPSKSDIGQQVVREYVESAKRILGDKFVSAYWFGSRSRGDAHPDSDVDILIEIGNPASERQSDLMTDVAIDLTAEYGVLLDVHLYSEKDLENVQISRSPFVLTVHEEGVKL